MIIRENFRPMNALDGVETIKFKRVAKNVAKDDNGTEFKVIYSISSWYILSTHISLPTIDKNTRNL